MTLTAKDFSPRHRLVLRLLRAIGILLGIEGKKFDTEVKRLVAMTDEERDEQRRRYLESIRRKYQ